MLCLYFVYIVIYFSNISLWLCYTVVTCPSLTLTNAVISYSNNEDFGSVATYTCNDGYALGLDVASRTCLKDGEWSGYEPVCGGENI